MHLLANRRLWYGVIGLGLFFSLIIGGYSLYQRIVSPPPSGIQIVTDPIAASVFVNDTYLDKTPLIDRNLLPGLYQVRIEPEDSRYIPYETTIELTAGTLGVIIWRPGETIETSSGVVYEMRQIDGEKAELSFTSVPENTVVGFPESSSPRPTDARNLTPVSFVDVEPGELLYEITAPSFETQRHTVNIRPGHSISVRAKLARQPVIQLEGAPSEVAPSPIPTPEPDTTASPSAIASEPTAESVWITVLPTEYFEADQEVLRIRSGPDLASDTLGFVPVGQNFEIQGSTDEWYLINYEGITGWISATYATVSAQPG